VKRERQGAVFESLRKNASETRLTTLPIPGGKFGSVVGSVACRAGTPVTLLNVLQLPPNYYLDPKGFSGLVDVRRLLREPGTVF